MTMLLLTLVIAFGLLQLGVVGAVTISTVDDANPSFTYLPASHWSADGQCQCSAAPDTSLLFGGTWHDTTRFTNDPPINITLTFNGIGISVYGVFWDPGDEVQADIDLTFMIDGAAAGNFIRKSAVDSRETFAYGKRVFFGSDLVDGQHTLVINLEPSSFFIFDRVEVITNDPGATTTTTTAAVATSTAHINEVTAIQTSSEVPVPTSDLPGAQSSSFPTAGRSSTNSPAIIGGTFGGVAVLTLIVAGNLILRRQRRNRDSALLPLTEHRPHLPRSSSVGEKSWTLIEALAWEGDLQGYQFLCKESVCTLPDIGVSNKWFITVSKQNIVFTNPEASSSNSSSTSKVVILNIPKRTVYELSYNLDDPNQRTIAHMLSPDGNTLIRWRKLSPDATDCIIEAADAKTNVFARRLAMEAKCFTPDIRASQWANNNTIYIPDSGRKVIIRWSVVPEGLESALIHPASAVARHQLLRFHITSDERWWIANGWTPGGYGGGVGMVEVHSVEGHESRVTPGIACCIAEVDLSGSRQALLVIADLNADKLLLKVEQLDPYAGGRRFEPLSISVDLMDAADCPQMVVAFQHLPIVAVVTTNNALYFFELYTGTYLFSQCMKPDEVWYGTSDGQSVLINQTQKDRVYRVFVNTDDLIGYVRQVLKNEPLASGLALKTGLSGGDDIVANDRYRYYQGLHS